MIAAILFVLLPVLVMSGEIDGTEAARIALPGVLTLVLVLGLLATIDRLIGYIAANAPSEEGDAHDTEPPNVAALGLYFACVVLAAMGLIFYYRSHPIVADLISYDFSGRRPGFLLIVFPLMLLLAYAKWIDDRTRD